MKPQVWNRGVNNPGGIPVKAVYVGRPTKWGNPWSHKPSAMDATVVRVKTRVEAVEKFNDWILSDRKECVRLRAEARRDLKGKHLVCWCCPELCHAEIWMQIANSKDDQELGL